jgi:hypothetical protein
LAQLVPQGLLVPLVQTVFKVKLVQLVLLDLQAQQEQLVLQDRRGLQATQEQLVLQV